MKLVHMVLQGKGGVGKSLIASLIAQHYQDADIDPICIDTDPVNQTFAGYKSFKAQQLDLMDGDDLNPRAFDELIEMIMAADDDAVFVVDNGAATFVPLCAWMIENEAVKFLKDADVKLVLHSVLTGGQAMSDTMVGLGNLLKHFPDTPIVVWENEFHGKLTKNGKTFEQSALYQNNQDSIYAIIQIKKRNENTFGYDLAKMLNDKMTFAEARNDPAFNLMARQRLIMIWRDLNEQITNANL